MAVKREWTEYEKQVLLKHIVEFKNRGFTIKEAACNFSKNFPHITPDQARVYYYKLINETENFRKQYSQRVWTQEENEILFDFIAQHKNKKKLELFNVLSEKLNRHPKAIASHYYSVKNNSNKFSFKYYSYFLSSLKSNQIKNLFLKVGKIQEIYEKAIEIEAIFQKQKIIDDLNRELQEARVKINVLEQKIMVS